MGEDMYETPKISDIGIDGFVIICDCVFSGGTYDFLVDKLSYSTPGCEHDAIQEGCISLYIAMGDDVAKLSKDELRTEILKRSSVAAVKLQRSDLKCGAVAGSGRLPLPFGGLLGIGEVEHILHIDEDKICRADEEQAVGDLIELLDSIRDGAREAGYKAIELGRMGRPSIRMEMARHLGVDGRTVERMLRKYRKMIKAKHAEKLEDALW